MIPNQRHRFDIPSDITFLNAAAYTPLMKSVYEAGQAGLERKYHSWALKPAGVVEEAETCRGLFANLIGATADDIAIVPSTAYGIATAAINLPLGSGRNVIVLEDQFPSNVFSWQQLAEDNSAKLVTVARPDDWNWTSAVLEQIDTETDIVTLPNNHWMEGSRLDLVSIGKRCREVGAAFVIDATQSVGAMALDVGELQPDFLICSAYKWLLCPYTLGFLYASPERQQGRPLELHRQNHRPDESAAGQLDYSVDFTSGARRFDMGERNNFINMPMAVAALTQLNEWGPAAIQETLTPLTDRVAEEAMARGWRVPGKDKRIGHYIGITPPNPLAEDMISRLEGVNFYLTRRGSGLRIAPHLFNDINDIEQLFAALDNIT